MANQTIENKAGSPAERKRFIRFSQVQEITSLSTSEVYRRIAEGTFPKQVRLGPRTVVWLESDVLNWMDVLVEQSRAREA